MKVERFQSEPLSKELTGAARVRWFARAYFQDLLPLVKLYLPGLTLAQHVRAARMMVAHTSAETGYGSGCFNHNPGNIHFVSGVVGTPHWYEGTDHDAVGNAYATRFAAYTSRRAGLMAKVAIVVRSQLRREVLSNGPANDYFLALKKSGYLGNPCGTVQCTDDQVRSMTAARMRQIEADTADLAPSETGRAIVAATAIGLGLYAAGVAADLLPNPLRKVLE